MTIITDVEEYVRWHPDVCCIQVHEALKDRLTLSRADSILCRLYTLGVLKSRRGDYFLQNGKRVRVYFYTHVLTYRGPRADTQEGKA